MKMEMM